MTHTKAFQAYFSAFASRHGFIPLAKLFKTQSGYYLYDPGTNKLFKCRDVTFAVLSAFLAPDGAAPLADLLFKYDNDILVAALDEIKETIRKERILSMDPDLIRFDALHFSDLENQITNHLGQLILEVTESCNLGCAYCVYNGNVLETRNHGLHHMDFATARKGIDYVCAHSSAHRNPAITFYGGEPLLRFAFIRRCVRYARKVFERRDLSFALTTNGTLITPQIADFLAKENFGVTISIDGPREIHDEYRTDKHGNGSFEPAMEGLKILVNAYGPKVDQLLNLSMVYTPPFSSQRLQRISSLWQDHPWIGKMPAVITYPHAGSIPLTHLPARGLEPEDLALDVWAMQTCLADTEEKRPYNPLAKSIVDRALIKLFRRPIFEAPVHTIHLNGCCVPGARKIHLAADGALHLCERVHMAPPAVGHIASGLDSNLIRRIFVDDYAKKSIDHCARCWAHRLCGLCYSAAFSDQAFDIDKKSRYCEGVVQSTEEQLKFYTSMLRLNPSSLNYLAEIEVG